MKTKILKITTYDKQFNHGNCITCGEEMSGLSSVNHSDLPKKGDFTVCIYCGEIMAFDDLIMLRALTPEEKIEAEGIEELVIMAQMIREQSRTGKNLH